MSPNDTPAAGALDLAAVQDEDPRDMYARWGEPMDYLRGVGLLDSTRRMTYERALDQLARERERLRTDLPALVAAVAERDRRIAELEADEQAVRTAVVDALCEMGCPNWGMQSDSTIGPCRHCAVCRIEQIMDDALTCRRALAGRGADA